MRSMKNDMVERDTGKLRGCNLFFLFLGCMGGFSIDVSISLLSDKVNDSKAEMDGR